MTRMRKNAWERYVAAARQAQGAGTDPAPAAKEAEKARRASRARRFARAIGRVSLAAARTAGWLLEFVLWLGLNLVIVFAVVLAAEAAGAKLPPWLATAANFLQAVLARAAKTFGFGA